MRKRKKHGKEQALKALGDAMRHRRVDLKLTQEEVGKAAKLHRTYVTDIENGLRNVSFLTLMRLAEALHCPLSLLMIETERQDGWEM